jgi:membrane-associated HD superfamily phosphohydrolase
VRSIKNPNEERVRDFVDKIVAARSADRQFDDCNLTLKQLDTIAEVVSQRILSNLHTRVAYPPARPEENVDNIIPMTGGNES